MMFQHFVKEAVSIKNTSKNKAFSLIEVLVYLAILMSVATASVGFLLSLNGFIDQYRLETMLYRSGTNALEQILVALREADAVDAFQTIEDDPAAGMLTVTNSATTTAFTFTGNELLLAINGQNYGNLANEAVSVDDFTVYYYPYSNGEFVRVRLTLSATLDGSASSKSISLYGGAAVRGATN